MKCIFCQIAAGALPASIVYEDQRTLAFLDIQPLNPGHLLVIPKQHEPLLVDLSPEDAGQLMRVGQLLDRALRLSDLRCDGVTLLLSDGRAAGQEVAHVHLHLIPRFEGENFEFQMDSGLQEMPGRAQLMDMAAKIKAGINRL